MFTLISILLITEFILEIHWNILFAWFGLVDDRPSNSRVIQLVIQCQGHSNRVLNWTKRFIAQIDSCWYQLQRIVVYSNQRYLLSTSTF